MKHFPWWLVIVVLMAVGFPAAEAGAHPRRPVVAPAFVPDGGFLLPDGVFYVRHGAFEVFWADGWYWMRDPRFGWYRAVDWDGPWVLVEPRWVPRPVVVLSHRPGWHPPRGAWYRWDRWERHHRAVRPPARWEPERRPPPGPGPRRWDRPSGRDHRHR